MQQNGPRLTDCQPTEGGAGPSPAPPAAPSPRLVGGHGIGPAGAAGLGGHLPLQQQQQQPLMSTFPSSSSHCVTPVLRSSSANPFSAPSSSPATSSLPQSLHPTAPGSYVAPPFFSTAVHTTTTTSTTMSMLLPPPAPSPSSLASSSASFMSLIPSSSSASLGSAPPHSQHSALRPSYSPPPSARASSLAAPLAPPSLSFAPPPMPTFTTSTFPFFPPVSMMRTSTTTGANFATPPTPPPLHRYPLSLVPPLGFGDQPFTSLPRFSSVPPSFVPTSTTPTTSTSSASRIGGGAMNDATPNGQRPSSRTSLPLPTDESMTHHRRSSNLQFQQQQSSQIPSRSPGLLPPTPTPTTAFPSQSNLLTKCPSHGILMCNF